MPEEVLTVREFERWARQFDERLQGVDSLHKVVTQNTIDIEVMKQSNSKARGVNGVISAVVAGVISGIAAMAGK